MALPGRLCFDKALRLRKRWEFLAVQGRGKRRHGRFMVVVACRGREGAPTRLGVTVTRKVGSAVVRNRVKRMIREAFRTQQWDLPTGLDVVVVARREAIDASFPEIKQELLDAVRVLSRKFDGPRR